MEVIGGHAPEGFWYPDGFLSLHAQELKEKLTYWIRKLRADRILTLDPWRTYEVHPDHVEAGRMASEAAVFSCFPLFFPEHIKEGLEPHQPKEVWYMVPTQQLPNRVVDIAETFEQKVRSVLCHESQVQMLADWFVPGADPKHLTAAHKEQLAAGVRDLLRMMSGAETGALRHHPTDLVRNHREHGHRGRDSLNAGAQLIGEAFIAVPRQNSICPITQHLATRIDGEDQRYEETWRPWRVAMPTSTQFVW
jgi:hypothetical protein